MSKSATIDPFTLVIGACFWASVAPFIFRMITGWADAATGFLVSSCGNIVYGLAMYTYYIVLVLWTSVVYVWNVLWTAI